MPIEQEVPMLLVEREALNNAREVEKDVSLSFSPHVSLYVKLPAGLLSFLYTDNISGVNAGTHSRP